MSMAGTLRNSLFAALSAWVACGCGTTATQSKPAEAPKAKEAAKVPEPAKATEAAKAVAPTKEKSPTTVPPGEWLTMFDSRSLNGWKVVKEDSFALAGKVEVKDGAIVLGEGMPFTGVAWDGEFPKEDFEVCWEARRQGGIDIFAGLTVPVGEEHVSLVAGGWGDSVVGLSSIDDRNASDNDQTKIMSFKNGEWHKFRLRVTKKKIEAWVDDKQVANVTREGHKFTIYDELKPERPFGFFSWSTEGAVRLVEMQRLKPE